MSAVLDALDQPHTQLFLRLVVGGMLALAGVSKLADRASFRNAVADYEVLPLALERPFAALLPLAEVTLGALLLLGLGTTVTAALAAPLFLSFVIAIGMNLARGRDFDCHCFGSVHTDPIGAAAFLRSLALLVATLVVAVGTSRFGALDGALFGASGLPPTSEVIPVVFLAAVVFDVLILLPETVAFRTVFSQIARTRITGAAHGHNGHHPERAATEASSAT